MDIDTYLGYGWIVDITDYPAANTDPNIVDITYITYTKAFIGTIVMDTYDNPITKQALAARITDMSVDDEWAYQAWQTVMGTSVNPPDDPGYVLFSVL